MYNFKSKTYRKNLLRLLNIIKVSFVVTSNKDKNRT